MLYDYAITVPAGTAEEDPVETEMHLTAGVIHRVEIEFRSGTDFRVACRIIRGTHQLFPTNPEGEFRADGRTIAFDDNLELSDEPFILKVLAYAPTAAYDHDIYVRIGVLPAEVVTPFSGVGGALRKFLSLVGVSK